MKKIFLLTTLFAIVVMFSCQKQLELTPKKIYYDNYYQTESDAVGAVNAVYSMLTQVNQYNSYLWLIQDVATDDCHARETLNDPNIHQFDQYNLEATNIYMTGIWQGSYLGIARANIVLEKVPEIEMDSLMKLRLLGEASFLRGLFYFNLVRLFGDVPLILKPVTPSMTDEELYVKRTVTSLVYDQIIEDFLFAAETAEKVMGSGIYGLWDDFTDNFKDINRNGKESIFAAQFYSGVPSQNNQIVISGLPAEPGLFPAGVEIMLPTEDLLNSFEDGDYRKESTFFDKYWFYEFGPHIWKHWDQDTYEPDQTAQCGSNFTVMRYAEVLLIYAEAMNELTASAPEAFDAINQVRERARNGNPDVLADLSGLSQEDLRTAILQERRAEFVNEGQRWYDLVRTGNLVSYVKRAKGDKANPQEFNNLFPIPQRELDNNAQLTQNPNYQ